MPSLPASALAPSRQPQVDEDTSSDILFHARVGDLVELKDTINSFASSSPGPPPSPLVILDAVQDEYTGNTVAHFAAANGHVDVLQWIRDEGEKEQESHEGPAQTSQFARTNKSGSTPLHYAAMNGALDVSKLLVGGIAPGSRSPWTEVPPDEQQHLGSGRLRELQRAYVELKNEAGRTAMFEAESAGKDEVAAFLVTIAAEDTEDSAKEDEAGFIGETAEDNVGSDTLAEDIQTG